MINVVLQCVGQILVGAGALGLFIGLLGLIGYPFTTNKEMRKDPFICVLAGITVISISGMASALLFVIGEAVMDLFGRGM